MRKIADRFFNKGQLNKLKNVNFLLRREVEKVTKITQWETANA